MEWTFLFQVHLITYNIDLYHNLSQAIDSFRGIAIIAVFSRVCMNLVSLKRSSFNFFLKLMLWDINDKKEDICPYLLFKCMWVSIYHFFHLYNDANKWWCGEFMVMITLTWIFVRLIIFILWKFARSEIMLIICTFSSKSIIVW